MVNDPEVKILKSFNSQMVDTVDDFLRADKNLDGRVQDTHKARQKRFVRLSEDLPATDDLLTALTSWSSASAVYIQHDGVSPNSAKSASSTTVTVYNPSEGVSYSSGDIGYIDIIGGVPCFIFAGGAGGGDVMAFTITDVDCPNGLIITTVASIIRYTGCGQPPGINTYTGEYEIEDYLGFLGVLRDDQMIGQIGRAIYWNDYPACVPHWDLDVVGWNGSCGV